MVETPDGGVVLVAGYLETGYSNKLFKLNHSESMKWDLLVQKLPFITSYHTALMIPDELADCG